MTGPWTKTDDETSKAYAAFCVYRDMGPHRSLAKTCRAVYGGSTANLRWIERWSTDHDWVARAQSFDEHEERERTRLRAEAREAGRQVFVEWAVELANTMVLVALSGGGTSAQVRALTESLDRAGVTVPRDVNLTFSDARVDSIREKMGKLADADLDELAALTNALTEYELEPP